MSIQPNRQFLVGEWRYLPEQDKLVKLDDSGQVYVTAELDNLCQKVVNYFILNAGRLITKDELLLDVWGIRDVSDGRVTRVIRVLRVALGDDTREPRYIETIPKRGYRFIATVTPIADESEPPVTGTAPNDPAAKTVWWQQVLQNKKWLLVLVILLGLLLWWSGSQLSSRDDDISGDGVIPMLRYQSVTAMDGLEFYHNVSADEQYLVFSYAANERESLPVLLLQHLGSHQRFQLTEASYSSFGAVFSPDGQKIAYQRMHPDSACEIRLAELNPEKTAVLRDTLLVSCGNKSVSARLSWSGDGKYLVYPSLEKGQKQMVLMLLPLTGGQPEQLTIPPASSFGDYAARFSRKGDKLVFLRDAGGAAQIWVLELASRATRMLVQVNDTYPGNVDWDLTDSHIIYPSGPSSLSRMPLHGGGSRLLAYTSNYANEVQLTASGRLFASVGFFSRMNIQKRANPLFNQQQYSELVFNSNRNESFVEANPVKGGPVAVVSRRSGLPQVWLFYPDGQQKQITSFEQNERFRNMAFSPDGSKLVIQVNNEIWLTGSGLQTHRLVNGEGAVSSVNWSRDGSRIFYSESQQGRWQIVSLDPEQPQNSKVIATDKELYQESFVADYTLWRDSSSKQFYIQRADAEPELLPIHLLDTQIMVKTEARAGGIYYSRLIDDLRYCLYYYDFETKESRVVVDSMYLA
ncbi:winged helix-turn-helix domain-containing protein, partial [Chromatiaceae bacterium AAb-1]|nr:winged helix-turn-helix domain-containing protein [Chromatiaceae bacterium AAb-1]